VHPSGCILVRSDPGLTELIELIETRRFDFVDRGKLAAGSSGTPDGKAVSRIGTGTPDMPAPLRSSSLRLPASSPVASWSTRHPSGSRHADRWRQGDSPAL
jgi:hypothetical protein